MRTFVAFIAAVLAGCAVLIPDYHAKRHIWTPPDPEVRVQLIPQGNLCATERDDRGVYYRPVMVLIHVIELPPLPATITLNGGDYVTVLSPSQTFVFRWRASVGAHRVDTDVGGHLATRVLSVHRCKPGEL